MSQLEFGQERYLRACIDPAKRIRATRHGGQWSETIYEGALGVSSTPVLPVGLLEFFYLGQYKLVNFYSPFTFLVISLLVS